MLFNTADDMIFYKYVFKHFIILQSSVCNSDKCLIYNNLNPLERATRIRAPKKS